MIRESKLHLEFSHSVFAAAPSGFALDLLGIAWAIGSMDLLDDPITDELRRALLTIGATLDNQVKVVPAEVLQQQPVLRHPETAKLPEVLQDLPEIAVLMKPPAWEVDTDGVGRGKPLSAFAQGVLGDRPILFAKGFGFGMPHRLDASSSGIVLVAKTFKAYFALRLQLCTKIMERDYIVLCHGWVPSSLSSIDARLHYRPAEGTAATRVDAHGRPALTRVTVVAHLLKRTSQPGKEHAADVQMSLVVLRIGTGRRHQIRTHLAHVGHPCVADGRYGKVADFIQDTRWCRRIFLHRYHLGFLDSDDCMHHVMAPLPADLREALGCLVPAEPQSAQALDHWLHQAQGQEEETTNSLRPWSSYSGLPQAR
eukprot:gnl/MRDRNA2_/MRDRNA2_85140_c0_seq2.p1 gnl/MRDRNA2_/MRDRNA2_85140_c0~~gnl/MRDRNA2_/MRDRNA2_85140_c0_seq2.p1  ORF type:complete len:368 (+),score=60.88 gnl/MRDRNA2_/MRDRNA2_85140_c0_seq2:436-1539(+)